MSAEVYFKNYIVAPHASKKLKVAPGQKRLGTNVVEYSSGALPSIGGSNVWRPLLSLLGFFFQPSISPTIIQSSIICLCLPLDLFPNIFFSITVFTSDSPLREGVRSTSFVWI